MLENKERRAAWPVREITARPGFVAIERVWPQPQFLKSTFIEPVAQGPRAGPRPGQGRTSIFSR